MTTGKTRFRIIPIKPVGVDVNVPNMRRDINGAMRRIVSEGQRFIAEYPPQRLTASGYRRTGTLKRSWSSKVDSTFGGVSGTVGSNSNIAPYNAVVQGSPQKSIFKTAGWRGLDDLADFLQDKTADELDRIIRNATR